MSIAQQFIRFAKPAVERFPSMALLYRLVRDSRYALKEPKQTPMGFKLSGNRSMEEGAFEQDEVAIVKKCLEKIDIFVNVGANIGYYCSIALSYGKSTIAFEPIELNLRYLYKNIKANHWQNDIEIFPIALGNKAGLIEIYGGGTGASLIQGWAGTPGQYVRLVPVSTLDNVLGTRFNGGRCFVLADIEGAERYMLEGAGRFLHLQPKPIWMLEISITEHQPKGTNLNPHLLSTFQVFWESGYEAWTADKHLRLVSLDEVKSICKGGRDTLLTHNFLFIEAGKKGEILDA
jgi:FkbM family methyltransferase